MANQITDNRTLVDSAEATTNYVGASPSQDTDIFIQGSASVAEQITTTRREILYNAGSTQNWSNNVFYLWVNCGVVGLLDTKANGGMTVRFCGPTVTNFFEFYVGGSDDWPTAVEGGWVQFVVDIEATPSNTGGTPPATSAIQHVGISAVTATVMTKASDNTWLDEIRRLPDGNPGIIVEGRNGGSTDWNSADILTQLGSAVGTFKRGPGGSYTINTPIQFGINDTSTHAFTDTNVVWLWENQEFAPTDLYSISAIGNSGGTTNVTFGVKTGTGDDAIGAQGAIITAASTGVRWAMDFDDPNLDGINFYGCLLQHGGDFQLDDPAVSFISTLMIDCTSATVSNCGDMLRCSIIDANTADSVAFMFTDDLTDIVLCSFQFSDGHAVELASGGPTTQTSKGNTFTGYGGTAGSNLTAGPSGSTDAAISNNNGSATTINVTTGGSTPSVRNESGTPSTTVNNNINVTLTGLVNPTEVRVYAAGTTTELAGQEDVTTGSFQFALSAGTDVDIRIYATSYLPADIIGFTVPSSDASIPVSQVFDRNYSNP